MLNRRENRECVNGALHSETQEMGGYVVIYEQVFPKYHRMSVGGHRKIV